MAPELIAFLTILVIMFIDSVGVSFTLPVIVPYGRFMGAGMDMIACFSTVRGIGGFISALWMPWFSDKQGRKVVLMLGLVGRALGYFIQGCSGWSRSTAIGIFMVGRAVAGLFSGNSPVITAYITEIYGHNKDLLSRRIVLAQMATQTAGIALQPISGILAKSDLQLPFFVCASMGMLGLLWTLCFFREARDVKARSRFAQAISPLAAQDSAPAGVEPQCQKEEGNPLCDIIILLCGIAFCAVSVAVVSIPFLVPFLLAEDSFGLKRETPEATQGEIAKMQAQVFLLPGLVNVVTALFLYIPVTKLFGGVPVIIVAGISAAAAYASIGFWVREVWQLVVALSAGGICLGFMFPAVSPLVARYSNVYYRTRLAFCQAIPMFGGQIASTFGHNIMALINGFAGLGCCWKVIGACMLTFTVLLAIAFVLVERRVPQSNVLSTEEEKMMVASSFQSLASFDRQPSLGDRQVSLGSGPHPRSARGSPTSAAGQSEMKQSLDPTRE